MARYVTTVITPRQSQDVFEYLADLRHLTEWDPGVRSVTQVSGVGGGADSVFDVTLAGIGRDVTLRYRTMQFDPHGSLVVRAESKALVSIDRVTVVAEPEGCRVTYDAELTLRGPLGLAGPLLGPPFRRIGDRAAAGLRRVLEGKAP